MTKWNFPNCLYAIDGKHVIIQTPENSAPFIKYWGTFSIILMMVVDADYKFITVVICSYGSHSDICVFNNTKFTEKLKTGKLNIRDLHTLPGDDAGEIKPFVFLWNEAFPLKADLLRASSRKNRKELDYEMKIYNHR